jgi:hypothetical protein
MKTRSSIASLVLVFSTLSVLAGCPADDTGDGDDEVGESDSTDSDSTDSDSTDESTDTDTDAGTDSTDGETGEAEPDVAACQQYCDAWYPCTNDQPQDGTCVAECLADLHTQPQGECFDNELVLLGCLAALTCEEHEAWIFHEEGTSYPCEAETEASCECLESSSTAEPGPTASDCSLDYSCVGETEYRVECSGEGCLCFVDGVEVGGCAEPVAVCTEVLGDGFEYPALDECCGWAI